MEVDEIDDAGRSMGLAGSVLWLSTGWIEREERGTKCASLGDVLER